MLCCGCCVVYSTENKPYVDVCDCVRRMPQMEFDEKELRKEISYAIKNIHGVRQVHAVWHPPHTHTNTNTSAFSLCLSPSYRQGPSQVLCNEFYMPPPPPHPQHVSLFFTVDQIIFTLFSFKLFMENACLPMRTSSYRCRSSCVCDIWVCL